MNKVKIELVTMTDVNEFVATVSKCKGKVFLESDDGFKVNGRSLIGAMAATEWDNLYVSSEEDIYMLINKWARS